MKICNSTWSSTWNFLLIPTGLSFLSISMKALHGSDKLIQVIHVIHLTMIKDKNIITKEKKLRVKRTYDYKEKKRIARSNMRVRLALSLSFMGYSVVKVM